MVGNKLGVKGSSLLGLFNENLAPSLKEDLGKVWLPPHQVEQLTYEELSEVPALSEYRQVIVSGETDNISLYLIGDEDVLIYTPFMDFSQNVVLSEISLKVLATYDEHLCLIEKTEELIERLRLPKLILINPCVKDYLPAPRLPIWVSSLASFLRKYQKADARILDMQTGFTIDGMMKEIKDFSPDVIGISITFGHLPLSTEILERIFSEMTIQKKTTVIAGNIIPTFGYEKVLQRFPELLICNSEGERTMVDLTEYVRGNKESLGDVSGITYIENGEIKINPNAEIEMDELPLPAMDDLEEMVRNKGSLSMETSRGCAHNACTFCPRKHRPKEWKGMSPQVLLKQLGNYKRIFDHFGIEPRIFTADEDFMGSMANGKEMERVNEIMGGIIGYGLNMNFDMDARISQIYNPKQSKEWHVEMMKTLVLCKKAGLNSLIIGVESGSDMVLERFNKKIRASDSVMALRILSALGIGCRVLFINFDPLMDFRELRENILFLERDDMLLQPLDFSKLSYSELFDGVHAPEFVEKNSLRKPLYENIDYVLDKLEILANSPYVALLKKAERGHDKELFIDHELDYNMARHKVRYLDDRIGEIAVNCQKWGDRHWALDYYLKGMYKIAPESEREEIIKFRTEYRKMCFYLYKSLVWIFDDEDMINMEDNIVNIDELMKLKERAKRENREGIMVNALDIFNRKMGLLVDDIDKAIDAGLISDNSGGLRAEIDKWRRKSGWGLTNP